MLDHYSGHRLTVSLIKSLTTTFSQRSFQHTKVYLVVAAVQNRRKGWLLTFFTVTIRYTTLPKITSGVRMADQHPSDNFFGSFLEALKNPSSWDKRLKLEDWLTFKSLDLL